MKIFKMAFTLLITLVLSSLVGPSYATLGDPLTMIELESPVHFLAADGSDVLVQPGTYQLEVAEEWLRLVPGERKDALLLEAMIIQHDEVLQAAKALSQSEDTDEHRIALLLPGGNGLEAIGSKSGIRSRAVKRRLSSRTRIPKQQAARIPTQSKRSPVTQQSKSLPKSSTQPNNQLAQRVQTLEQQVSTLLATIDSLQSRLANMESAVQVSNSGQVTVQGTTLKLSAAMIDVRAATAKFSGVVQSNTLITNSVISKSYTPGAGNIW